MDSEIRLVTLVVVFLCSLMPAQARELTAAPSVIFHSQSTEEKEQAVGPLLWLPLLHRDTVLKSRNVSYDELLKRDAVRVAAIDARVKGMDGSVFPGVPQGSNQYFTRIGVGTPARDQLLTVDTGSDDIWIQCEPCNECYPQSDPIFNPALSSTYNAVQCTSNTCHRLDIGRCSPNGTCVYEAYYGDGSHTTGNLATDTIKVGKTSVQNAAIGCGHDNRGLFVAHAGVLGLSRGALSLPSQLSHYDANIFSYCLVDRESQRSSTLEFGPQAVPNGAIFAPLLKNKRYKSFYYVSLVGISVDGKKLPFEESVFLPDASGQGGTIMDSGTAVTRLQRNVYEALRDAFVAAFVAETPLMEKLSSFDTCYDLSVRVPVNVPTIAFHFSNGNSLSLSMQNILMKIDNVGTSCLAFARATLSMSIIGHVQQQGMRVSYDPLNNLVGFTLNNC